jgi:DNA-binding CsgD family transcriptional regulator
MHLQETQGQGLSSKKVINSISSYLPSENILSTLDAASIGIIICDRRLRYRALNQNVAKIHNVPIRAHLGHSFHQILGGLAEKVVPFWEAVFATGRPLSNLDFTGRLPKRSGIVRLIESLFPVMDTEGRVAQVGCFVIEITAHPVSTSPPSNPAAKITSATGDQFSRPDQLQPAGLSRREQEVVRLLAQGKSNKEISTVLAISVRTVETYRSRLMLKLQATSIVDLVFYAIRNRIVKL